MHPLKMKYTYQSALGHIISEYIWLWGSISKTLEAREQTNRQIEATTFNIYIYIYIYVCILDKYKKTLTVFRYLRVLRR